MTMQSVKPFTSVARPYREVLEGRIVEALRLADIYIYNELKGRVARSLPEEGNPLLNPEEFLRRTYFSKSMKRVILKVLGALAGMRMVYTDERGRGEAVGSNVIVIPSHLGGGKTHLLATLYYIVKLYGVKREFPQHLREDKELVHGLKHIDQSLREEKIYVVAIVGDDSTLGPIPSEPAVIDGVEIYTPWGLLAFTLGEYSKLVKADREHRPPTTDVLIEVLRGKRVLILVDEAVEYMARAVPLNNKYPGFSESFVSFIRNLAEAVSRLQGVVLVVSMPVEYRGGVVYETRQHPEYARAILSMLGRVMPEFIPPLELREDIAEVFKKRLFENSGSLEVVKHAELVASLFEKKFEKDSAFAESVKSKYGDKSDLKSKVKLTYPFHPYYVELMASIALRTPELGLTRQLLAYTAKLVRHLYDLAQRRRDLPVSTITPWLIPLEKVEFRVELVKGFLSQVQAELNRIYEQDVRTHSTRLEELLFADRKTPAESSSFIKAVVSRTIWLSTIPGGGGKGADAFKLYPFKNHYPVIVYDPLAMEAVPSADVLNAIEELKNESIHLYVSEDNRVFYALVPDILPIIRQRYLEKTDYHALQKLESYINKLSFRPGRKIKKVVPVLAGRTVEIEEIVEKEVALSPQPVLVVYLGLQEPPRDLQDVVLKKNNVVLLVPDYSLNPLEHGLYYTERIRRVLGSEPPTMSEFIRSVAKLLSVISELRLEKEYLKASLGEEYLERVLKTLESIESELEKLLVSAVYSSLKRAYLGVRKTELKVDLRPIGEEDADLSNMARLLEEVLARIGVISKWDWTTVYSQLKNWDVWDVDMSPKRPVKVGDIWSQLLYSPAVKPHLTSFDDFIEALKSAYNSNLVAFRIDGQVVWLKHPYTPEEAKKLVEDVLVQKRKESLHDWERDVIQELHRRGLGLADLEVVSTRAVVKEYVEQLKQKATTKPGEKVVRYLVIYTEDGRRDFLSEIPRCADEKCLVELLSKNPVVLLEEKPPYTFTIEAVSVNGKPVLDEPASLESTRKALVQVTGVVKTQEEPRTVEVVVEVRDMKGERVSSRAQSIKPDVPFEIKVLVEQPGEYIVVLYGELKEPKSFKTPERVVAKLIVRGEVCEDKSVKPLELLEFLDKPESIARVEVKEAVVEARFERNAVTHLMDLLAEMSRLKSRVFGRLAVKLTEESFELQFSNTDPIKVSNVLRAVEATSAESIDVSLRFKGLSHESLKNTSILRKIARDPYSPLFNVITLNVRECRRL